VLEIRFLGQYEIKRDGQVVAIESRPSRLLFAYLALTAGKHHPRERLAGLLWPESDESCARSNLRQTLWRLRKALGEDYLLVDNKTVAFNSGCPYWLDTALLEDRPDQDLTEAVSAYEGELLPGYYEDWVLLARERLQAAFERKIERLLQTLEQQGRWTEVVRWAEQWIAFGQTPEPAYRALMIAHAAKGDLAAAAGAYERCRAALQLEVDVEPSSETKRLYERLIIGRDLPAAKVGEGAGQPPPRHNLPHQSTPFIGRERELDQVRKLLSGRRFLTLVGPGGTGKTRLAQQAASELVGEFKHGVFFVSLASIDFPDFIVQAIAETIGFPLSSREDPRRQLLRHLRHRHYLLVLDSYEHLLPGAALVSEILHHAGQVKIICTSRERLNLHEETLLRIEGMAYPRADGASSAAADALDFCAVKLFVESAKRSSPPARPDFMPGAEDLQQITRICQLLEGMPLGILLAAAWVELLTPAEIAAEITRSLDFLQAAWRDVPQRHLSVRAAFDPSWQMLTDAQQELFVRLAVFKSSFSREAAKKVAGASLWDLAGLVDKSLLRHDLQTGRYHMHELLRQYAQEHLQTMPDGGESALQAHAVYFADLMQQQWLRLISEEQQMALTEIDADLENLRSSWRYWLKKRDAARIRMYVRGFWRVHDIRSWCKTGMELFREAAAALRPALGSGDEETEIVYAEVLTKQAFFLTHFGYADKGQILARESVDIIRRHQCFQDLAIPLEFLRYCNGYVDDPLNATLIDTTKLTFREGREGQWEKAFVSGWQSWRAVLNREYELARHQVKESLAIFNELGDVLGTIWPRVELGNIAVVQGAIAEAKQHYAEALRVAQETKCDLAVLKTRRYLGNIATLQGDYQAARAYFLASLKLADALGFERDVVSALYDIATVEADAGDKEKAVRLLALVEGHPLSDQTRTFSSWSGDPVVHFCDLATLHLTRLQEELEPDVYAAALVAGQALELDTAVLDLLAVDALH
jgi:predicted ATPase/DNA-binding SARP family transcriptional activator